MEKQNSHYARRTVLAITSDPLPITGTLFHCRWRGDHKIEPEYRGPAGYGFENDDQPSSNARQPSTVAGDGSK